jgi:hypothetical protein
MATVTHIDERKESLKMFYSKSGQRWILDKSIPGHRPQIITLTDEEVQQLIELRNGLTKEI